jgi:hypothetical protein
MAGSELPSNMYWLSLSRQVMTLSWSLNAASKDGNGTESYQFRDLLRAADSTTLPH